MKRSKLTRALALLLAAAMLLSCAACGGKDGGAAAASMWLVKTEGDVSVTDDEGGDVALIDRLGLFSGYGVATRAASYGWIDLDETKLTKMDENSDVEVQKDGRNLTLTVNSGALFFNVTKPLEDDETLEIRCSDMVTAIRGTSGWVRVEDRGHMYVYILDGTVACSVSEPDGGKSVTRNVSAGEYAELVCTEDELDVIKGEFDDGDIPLFVRAEIGDESGGDVQSPEGDANASGDTSGDGPSESAAGAMTVKMPIGFQELRELLFQENVTSVTIEPGSGSDRLELSLFYNSDLGFVPEGKTLIIQPGVETVLFEDPEDTERNGAFKIMGTMLVKGDLTIDGTLFLDGELEAEGDITVLKGETGNHQLQVHEGAVLTAERVTVEDIMSNDGTVNADIYVTGEGYLDNDSGATCTGSITVAAPDTTRKTRICGNVGRVTLESGGMGLSFVSADEVVVNGGDCDCSVSSEIGSLVLNGGDTYIASSSVVGSLAHNGGTLDDQRKS